MKRYSIYFVWLFVVLMFLSACSNKAERTNTLNGYETKLFSITKDDGYNHFVANVLYYDDEYFICASRNDKTTEQVVGSDIYVVNEDGVQTRKIEFDTMIIPECIIDGELSFVSTTNEVVFMDCEKGVVTHTHPIDSTNVVSSLVPINDGYLVLLDGEILIYDSEGVLDSKVENSKFQNYDYYNAAFEIDNEIYVVINCGNTKEYYKLDKSKETSEQIFSNINLGANTDEIYGKYIINSSGEYIIDFTNLVVKQIADWNNINIIPPRKNAVPYYITVDDNHFTRLYNYTDGTADVVLFNYDNTIDYSNATQLVIGGYGVKDDLTLAQAVYEYNSTHSDYRFVLEDYNENYADGYTATDIQQNLLSLTQYFVQGNSPDIYYGNSFDYNQFGSSGMVQNLTSYLLSDDELDIYDSIKNTMFTDNQCYSIFPGFFLDGYWGTNVVFGDNTEVSYSQLSDISHGTSIYGNDYAYNIAASTICYNLREFYDNASESRIQDILDFAVENGLSSTAPHELVELPTAEDISEGDYLLSIMGITNIHSFARMEESTATSLRYIGYPSVSGSVHLVEPICQLAMSADTLYSDQCWELMKYVLSDQMQDYVISSSYIPVTQNSIEKMMEYSVDKSLVPSDNDILIDFFDDYDNIPQWIVDDFKMAIDDVDTIKAYDWGIYGIIQEETSSYYLQDKPTIDIASTLHSRIEVYINENYSWE